MNFLIDFFNATITKNFYIQKIAYSLLKDSNLKEITYFTVIMHFNYYYYFIIEFSFLNFKLFNFKSNNYSNNFLHIYYLYLINYLYY